MTRPETIEANKENMRRFVDDALNRGLLDVVDRSWGQFAEEIKAAILAWRIAFPDFRTTIEDLVAEDDWGPFSCRGSAAGLRALTNREREGLRFLCSGIPGRMPLLLVDDRDGRIVAEVDADEALELLEAWARADGTLPAYFSIVEFESRHGAILGADTSVAIRPLR